MLKIFLKKIFASIKRDGVYPTLNKLYYRFHSVFTNIKLRKKLTNNNWTELKNKYEGKRVFLIGNGPSINKTPLYLLKNEYTLCFNRFFIIDERINFKPTFYVTTDNIVLSDIIEEVKKFIPETTYSFLPDIHYRGENFYEKIGNLPNLYWLHQLHGEGFSKELPKVIPGGSVIYEGIQILNYLGFKEIYLLGVDLSYTVHNTVKYLKKNSLDIESQEDDDPNHFDPRYFGKNRKYHQPEAHVVQNIFRNLKYISEIQHKLNFTIINVGIESKLEYFPKKNLGEILSFTFEEQEEIFNELISKKSSYKDTTIFENSNRKIENIIDIELKDENDFYTNLENAPELINKAIFTHIPLGPFNNKYYFIKRK
jgi:hypothetical protein